MPHSRCAVPHGRETRPRVADCSSLLAQARSRQLAVGASALSLASLARTRRSLAAEHLASGTAPPRLRAHALQVALLRRPLLIARVLSSRPYPCQSYEHAEHALLQVQLGRRLQLPQPQRLPPSLRGLPFSLWLPQGCHVRDRLHLLPVVRAPHRIVPHVLLHRSVLQVWKVSLRARKLALPLQPILVRRA